jgi:hypothetical protein
MRNVVVFLGLTLLAVLILLPVTRSVNAPVGNPILDKGSVQADGTPLPPFPPKKPRASSIIVVADGTPLPPFPPKKPRSSSITIVADGTPLPPFPPKKPRTAAIMVSLSV